MRDPIARYVSDLDAILHFELPESTLETITLEAESHLRESAAQQVAKGMDPARAQALAIDAYGRPERVALGYLRRSSQKLWGLPPGYWAALGALIGILCWNFHWLTLQGYFDNFGDTWQNYLAGVIGVAALPLIVVATRRRFRSNWAILSLVTIGAAALSIPVTAYWMIAPTEGGLAFDQQGISRFHLRRDLPVVAESIRKIGAYEDVLRAGIGDYASATSEHQIPEMLKNPPAIAARFGLDRLQPAVLGATMNNGGKFVVPRKYGAFVEIDGRTWVFETVDNFGLAKKMWAESGPSDVRDLEKDLAGLRSIERNATDASNGRLFFFQPELYSQTIFATLFLLPFFLLLDGIAVLTSRPRGRRRSTRALA